VARGQYSEPMMNALFCGLRGGLRLLFRAPCAICSRPASAQTICRDCAQKIARTRWGFSSLSLEDHRIPVIWREPYGGVLTETIYRSKYRSDWGGAKTLGACLGQIPNLWLGAAPTAIPIPLADARLASRGFNQSHHIAASAARHWGLEFQGRWLLKTRTTDRQASLSKQTRSENLIQTFSARPAVKGRRILLIDDIMTTGATLKEAARAIAHAGGLVIGAAVIARVQQDQRTKNPRHVQRRLV
jgi:ComF family protein